MVSLAGCLLQAYDSTLVTQGKVTLTSMGFDVTGLVQVIQEGCDYADYVDILAPPPTPAPTVCPPANFTSAKFVDLGKWSTNPFNASISWFAQEFYPTSLSPEADAYCAATTYSVLDSVGSVVWCVCVCLCVFVYA